MQGTTILAGPLRGLRARGHTGRLHHTLRTWRLGPWIFGHCKEDPQWRRGIFPSACDAGGDCRYDGDDVSIYGPGRKQA